MKDLNGVEYNLDDFISYARGKKTVIFGAGKYGKYIYEIFRENRVEVCAICDNNREKLDSLKEKYPVSTLEDLKDSIEEYYFVIAIVRIEIVKVIRNQLNHYGVKPDKIVIPFSDIKSDYYDGLVMFDSEYGVHALKEQWRCARQGNGRIADYFELNDLYVLIVFGIDELKGWLEQDLLNSGIIIKKIINKIDEFTEADECDAVVVLDEVNYEVIEEKLMQRTKVPIISIWDVIRF